MEKTALEISGMHCRSCEMLVEQELLKVPGVTFVSVSQTKGQALVTSNKKIDPPLLEKAVNNAGYQLGKEKTAFFSKNISDYRDLLLAILITSLLFLTANFLGLSRLSFNGNLNNLLVVLLVGLTAGLSTCMALIGGLVLAVSSTNKVSFGDHLLFNVGRIISFFIFGALLGWGGSFFQLSPFIYGLLIIGISMVMIVLGIQLTKIVPGINTISLRLPVNLKHHNPMVMGALTFLLPCGFTQTMALFAISSGNPLTASLTMGVFAIGTAPGLLGLGGLATLATGWFGRIFFRTVGVAVVLLALFNFSNGWNLTGINLNPTPILSTMFSIENGIQTINMTQDASGYHPNSFTLKKNVPVKWVINSTDPRTCANSIYVNKYGIKKFLKPGENVIEFTPTETGTVKFTCSMGMYTGVFNVIN